MNLFLQPFIVLQYIEPTEDEWTQSYYTQVVGLVGVDEGEYKGTIFMDVLTPTKVLSPSVQAADMSPPVVQGIDGISTPSTMLIWLRQLQHYPLQIVLRRYADVQNRYDMLEL